MDITYSYTKARGAFGRQPQFCFAGPAMCDSIAPDPTQHRAYILRNPVHQPTQHTPPASQNAVNTYRAEYSSSGANHSEGGWPKDVNILDPEATQRYRRKIEKDDGYIHCVFGAAPGMDHYVHQNNAIDMYQIYYSELAETVPPEHCSARVVNVFRDPTAGEGKGRPVSSIAWQSDGGSRFVATYVDMDYNRKPRTPTQAYVWDLENANAPEVTLTTPGPLLDLQFNPRDPTMLAGGLADGRVGIWDRRRASGPVELCATHEAHRDIARNVFFVNSKSGLEFFSGGVDGAVKWWDTRNMSEPIEVMALDLVKGVAEIPSLATAHGVSALEYEPTIPTRFMVGTEDGLVLSGNRKGKTPLERLPPAAKVDAHLGPVWSLERSPTFMKNFLTVGDWTLRIWSEDCRESPVLWSPSGRQRVCSATWSPTRVSLVLVVRADGVLACWDLLRRQHCPSLSLTVCPEPLVKVRAHEAGALVALGSARGAVYLTELSTNLVNSGKNDKGLMTALLERESKRERILEAKLREIRLKIRQAEEGSVTHSLGEPDPSTGDRDLAEAGALYLAAVKKEMSAM